MKLSRPLPQYDANQAASNQYQLESADRLNHKKEQDIEVGDASIILTSPNGTRYKIEIDNSGTLSTSAA